MRKWIVGCSVAALLAAGLLAQDKKKAAGDATKGKDVFDQCAVCHNTDSDDVKVGPSLKGLFKHAKLANGKPVTEANVLAQINDGGNGMPAYQDLLSDEDKANVIAYLKTL
ncbi:MAG TPA: cytochrome c [Bryobacteraceae bacterium]|nr:cytochrome c [Bryobacteraceae bacterium]